MSGTNQEIEGSTTVQSVTGPNVDNTDPANPVVNPLGLIKIVDLNGEFFTDLATASAYVATFTITTVTEESYFPVSGTLGGVYYFTVPKGSAFNLADNFLSDSAFIITASAYMEDRLGLITSFNNYAFYNSSGDNKIGNNCIFKDSAFDSSSGNNTIGDNCSFNDYAFYNSSGNNTIGDNCSFNNYAFDKSSGIYTLSNFTLLSLTNVFAANTTGKFILNGTIGASTAAEYSNFFTSSTATIFARKEAYTNNAGGIEGDLQTAISNGCNVQFDGINLATIPNLALKSPIASPTFTGTPLAPTASANTNNTQIATTAYVDSKTLFKSTTDSSTHTGTLTNTIIWSEDISNKLSSGDIADLISDVVRVSGSTAATIRYYLNSSASLSGATQIGQYIYGFSGLNIADFRRQLIVKSNTSIRVKGTVSSMLNDYSIFGNYADVTVNLASLYVIFAITLGNTGDQFLVSSSKMVR